MSDKLAELISTKKGCTKDADNVVVTIKAYENSFRKLASNTVVYQPDQAKTLLDAIEKCKNDNVELVNSDVTSKLVAKLDKMIKPVDMMDLLGF